MMVEVRKQAAEDADISPCQNPSPKCPRESMASAGHPINQESAGSWVILARCLWHCQVGTGYCRAKSRQTEKQGGNQWARLVNVRDCRLCRGVDLRARLESVRFQSNDCGRPPRDGKTAMELRFSSALGSACDAAFAGCEGGPGSPCGNARVRMLALACSLVATAATLKGKREAWSRGPEGDLGACQRDGSRTACSNVACWQDSTHKGGLRWTEDGILFAQC